jgi:catechol 2,3-dioxygenase-like lactoylglutathione lyase family enzyme
VSLLSGINHIAILTEDLARFIAFYAEVFETEVLFREQTPQFEHAILRVGHDCWLHPAQVYGAADGAALPDMFRRGHLDHIALTASSSASFQAVRQRLLDRDATNGVVEDLGAFHALWFRDPDGMRSELALIIDPGLGSFHAPRKL